jgi:NAD(P)-dependent dehydrogenase (short-subunit alcohol dehydrogenase family)
VGIITNKNVALVTGSSSGFGLLTCIALAKEGFRVIASMRNPEKAEKLAAAAGQAGVASSLEIVQLDVTDFEQIELVVQQTVTRHGRIDLLVNNAGYAAAGFVEELSLDQWQHQFDANFFGLVAVTKAVLPHMRKRQKGTIINISSISGRIGFPGLSAYAASKHAVEGFSESLRLELLPYNVHVVLIEPGSYKTEIWSKGTAQIKRNPDSPYAGQLRLIDRQVERIISAAPEPDEVIAAIVKAATSPHPRLRYPVGKGVFSSILLKNLLPWRFFEWIIAKRMGLHRLCGK